MNLCCANRDNQLDSFYGYFLFYLVLLKFSKENCFPPWPVQWSPIFWLQFSFVLKLHPISHHLSSIQEYFLEYFHSHKFSVFSQHLQSRWVVHLLLRHSVFCENLQPECLIFEYRSICWCQITIFWVKSINFQRRWK